MSRFDALIGAHIPHLRRYARALTGDVTRADDLVQDTLERAWIKFHLWQPALDLRPWLFTIMHNLYVNQVRANIRRERIPASDGEAERSGARPNQTDMLEVSEVIACLDRLPPEQREVLLLVSLESLNYTQVGKILGIPVGTVTSRLARARARLRILLEGGAGEGDLKVVK
ncbi:MAG: RNA polymerase sigma factor [Burkholderiales bacterium]